MNKTAKLHQFKESIQLILNLLEKWPWSKPQTAADLPKYIVDLNLVSIDRDQNRKTTPVLGNYIFDFEFTKGLTMAKTAKPQHI